ncbi:MAG: hypothetical protein ACP5N2_04270 [Candidatus Nanoarchaeia archaeon]
MADKKDEKPQHIKDYDKLKREANIIKKTTTFFDLYHDKVAAEALLKHLKDEDGNIDNEKLLNADVREAIKKDIIKGYDLGLSDYYKTDMKGLSKSKQEIMRKQLMGISSDGLGMLMETYGKDFSKEVYNEEVKKKLKTDLSEALIPSTFAHINMANVPDLLKHAKLDHKFNSKMIDLLKDPKYKQSIGQLLYMNHVNKGNIDPEIYQKLGLSAYLNTDS